MKNSSVPIFGATILATIGLLLIFGPLLHLLSLHRINTNYLHVAAADVVSLPIMGIVLLYTSIFVYQRRILAAIISIALCLLALVYLIVSYAPGKVTPFVVLLIGVYVTIIAGKYKVFTIRNNIEGIGPYLKRIGAIAVIGIMYGVIGFAFFGERLFHQHFSVYESIDLTLDSLTGFSGTITVPTQLGHLFIDSLAGIGITLFVLLLNSLFRPLRLRLTSNQHGNQARTEAIIKAHSKSSEDYFKLWPNDKRYFFSENKNSFIAYKPSGHTVVILGDPVGVASDFPELIKSFAKYCYSLGWSLASINVTPKGQKAYEMSGLSSVFIGNEGVINVRQFMTTTKNNKHFRYITNKARRDNLHIEEWNELTHQKFTQLRDISNNWLRRGGRREYTFFMGYFDRRYLERCRVFVLFQDSVPMGYVNLIPSYYKSHASMDNLRNREGISSAGMHFLLMKVIETLHNEHFRTLNIGLAPLSGIKKKEGEMRSRAMLRVIRLLGASYYSFQGLEQFKNKFEPRWEHRYMAYGGTFAGLIRVVRNIEHVSSYGRRGNRYVYLTTIVGVAVLTVGLYLFLA